jgi:hypothetical protein
VPGKVLRQGIVVSSHGGSMKDDELKALVKKISSAALKSEVKKRGIKMGSCPTKMDFAKKLPEEVLKDLAGK